MSTTIHSWSGVPDTKSYCHTGFSIRFENFWLLGTDDRFTGTCFHLRCNENHMHIGKQALDNPRHSMICVLGTNLIDAN